MWLNYMESTGNGASFCRNCGRKIDARAEICPKCGVRVKASFVKHPGIAAVLSFFWPGVGQIYNGQIGKGIAFVVIAVSLALSMFILIGFVLYPIFWIYNIWDAYKTAKQLSEV